MPEITLPAKTENLPEALDFVIGQLPAGRRTPALLNHLQLALEEVFVNIASYAYGQTEGTVTIRCTRRDDPLLEIQLVDRGAPYNPLDRPAPDLTLTAAERVPGGLGIFLVRQCMDSVDYAFRDGCNILTLRKKIP